MVGRYHEIGVDEFVLYWPQTWRDATEEAPPSNRLSKTCFALIGSGPLGDGLNFAVGGS